MSLQSLFDLAAAFDLPVWIDMPEWKDWFELINDVPNRATRRSGFDLDKLVEQGLEYSRNENTPITSSGRSASAASEPVKNTVMAPPQMHQILTAPLNENALSAGSNQLRLEKIDRAITSAVLARSVAA